MHRLHRLFPSTKSEQGWKLKDNVSEWEKKEFREFMNELNSEPDETGIVILR